MSADSRLRVGYVLKRFPRASETFIAREILDALIEDVRGFAAGLAQQDDMTVVVVKAEGEG